MGGFGSGRWGWHRPAPLAEHSRSLDLTQLAADGTLRPGAAGALEWRKPDGAVVASVRYAVEPGPVLRLSYRVTRQGVDPQDVSLPVRLVRLPAPRGGGRWVGICPLAVNGVPCGRRAAKFFLPPGAVYFGCRRCHRLAYRSSREHDRRVDAVRRDPAALARLLDAPVRASVAMLGLALTALRQDEAAAERATQTLERKAERRRRRRAKRNQKTTTTGGQPDDGDTTA